MGKYMPTIASPNGKLQNRLSLHPDDGSEILFKVYTRLMWRGYDCHQDICCFRSIPCWGHYLLPLPIYTKNVPLEVIKKISNQCDQGTLTIQ